MPCHQGHTQQFRLEMCSRTHYLVIHEDGTQQGPATAEVIKGWMDQGVVTPSTLLQNVETGENVPASSIIGIAAVPIPPPIAPPPLAPAQDVQDSHHAAYPRPEQKNPAAYGALDMLVPVRADIFAVAAGYFGLFSLVVIGAPFALLFGIIALRRIKQNPERTGKGRAWFGIVMGALVLGLLGFSLASSLLG